MGCSTEARVRLHSPSNLRGRDSRVVVVFGVAILERDLTFSAGGDGGSGLLASGHEAITGADATAACAPIV